MWSNVFKEPMSIRDRLANIKNDIDAMNRELNAFHYTSGPAKNAKLYSERVRDTWLPWLPIEFLLAASNVRYCREIVTVRVVYGDRK